MEAPVSKIIPSYPFVQYRDDPNVVAFFQAYNEIAQEYLDEINALSIPYWPSPALSGKLLDWVVEGIYGETRPLLQVSQDAIAKGAYNTIDYNTIPYAGLKNYVPGATTYVVDDYFKRILTWNFYKGDGVQFNIDWLKRRIARFLRGPNGIDPPVTNTFDISIVPDNGVFNILIPDDGNGIASFLKEAIEQEIVKLPFIYKFQVEIYARAIQPQLERVLVNGVESPSFSPVTAFVGAKYQLKFSGGVGGLTLSVTGPATITEEGEVTVTDKGIISVTATDKFRNVAIHTINPSKFFYYDGTLQKLANRESWATEHGGRLPAAEEYHSAYKFPTNRMAISTSATSDLPRENGSLIGEWGGMDAYGWLGYYQSGSTMFAYNYISSTQKNASTVRGCSLVNNGYFDISVENGNSFPMSCIK